MAWRILPWLFPCVILLFAYLAPAQPPSQELNDALRSTQAQAEQPPVDKLGSGSLAQQGPMGNSKIFWSNPEPGIVHGTLVIEPSPKTKSGGAVREGQTPDSADESEKSQDSQ